MITSGASQYLHPDYLQPLPTTLDAKKSPLALLAQTCSSIGKDTSPGKNIIPPLEKKEGDKKKETGGHNGKVDSPPRTSTPEDRHGRDSAPHKRDSGSPREEKRSSKDLPALVPISSSSSSSSHNDKASPPPSHHSSGGGHHDKDSKSSSSSSAGGPERDSSSAPATSQTNNSNSSNSRISLSCGNMLLEVNHHETNSSSSSLSSSAAISASSSASKTITTSSTSTTPSGLPKPGDYPTAAPGLHGHLGAAYPGCGLPLLGHHIPVDTATATPIHPAAISVHSSMGLSHAQKGLPSAHGLSPYTYARVKSASGATTLVPICRDPYCTNCQLTMQNAQFTSSTCAAGCTQCNHEKTLPTSLASSFGSALGTVPVLPLGASALAPSASALASSYYSHAFSMLPGGHHTVPYVCNWMAGSDYCGKRFSTSEELLQHLRTHTSSSDAAALASLYPGLGLSAAAAHASLAACHTAPPHYPPGSLSPNSLRQAYPRSLSPNSLLAAARYHPYKSPLSLPTTLPSAAGLPSAALPAGLAPYYSSAYALYGQRLGAAAP